jgi:hypothetical protein
MNSPFAPIALFVALILSVSATVPLSDAAPELAILAALGFLAALAGLACVVIRADRAQDPRWTMRRAAERFDERWPRFVRDFWAHVDALEAAADVD